MIGMLLAAGLGTRMRPLTRSLSKPAMPLLGDPMVVHGLRALATTGVTRAVVNLHHRPEDVRRATADPRSFDLDVVYFSEEAELMGTAGALRHAARWLRAADVVAVRNGDFLADIDAAAALACHRASGLPATMVLTAPRPGYTPVPVSDDGRVLGFGDDAPRDRVAHRLTFTGLHFLDASLLDRLPPGRSDLVPALYADLAREGRLGAFVHHGFWWEFGDPRSYRDGVLRLLGLSPAERDRVLHHDPVSLLGNVPVAVGPGAGWDDGVEWSGAVAVGAGCRIDRRARLADTVLLPGCRVGRRAVLRGCLVGPGATVPDHARFENALLSARTDDGPPPEGVTVADDLWIRTLEGAPVP